MKVTFTPVPTEEVLADLRPGTVFRFRGGNSNSRYVRLSDPAGRSPAGRVPYVRVVSTKVADPDLAWAFFTSAAGSKVEVLGRVDVRP